MKTLWFKLLCFVFAFSRATFYRDMADSLRRASATRDFLARELENARMVKDSTRTAILLSLVKRFASGESTSISGLMVQVAPKSDQMLLSAVDDATKDKPAALDRAADAVDFQIRSFKVLAANLLTPLIALPAVGSICIISADIIDLIDRSMPSFVWEGFNAFIRVLASAINQYWVVSSFVLLGVVTAFVMALPRWTGSVRIKVENWPGFALFRDYNAATVLSALAMMMGSGKPLVEALQDLRRSSSPWLRWHIQRILFSLEDNPTDYSAAFARGLMPPAVRARLSTLIDSSKSFDSALITLGSAEVKRLESSVKTSAEMLNWALVGSMTIVAVLLSVGQLTVSAEISNQTSISKIMQNKK